MGGIGTRNRLCSALGSVTWQNDFNTYRSLLALHRCISRIDFQWIHWNLLVSIRDEWIGGLRWKIFQSLPFNMNWIFSKSLTNRLPVSPLESPRVYSWPVDPVESDGRYFQGLPFNMNWMFLTFRLDLWSIAALWVQFSPPFIKNTYTEISFDFNNNLQQLKVCRIYFCKSEKIFTTFGKNSMFIFPSNYLADRRRIYWAFEFD